MTLQELLSPSLRYLLLLNYYIIKIKYSISATILQEFIEKERILW